MNVAELRALPRIEKLKIIEALWSDLAGEAGDYESPAWHGEELRKTEKEFAEGSVEILDWNVAKKALRERFE
jgi:hypothetical protein